MTGKDARIGLRAVRPGLVDSYVGKELLLPFLWGICAFTAIMLGIQALFELVKLAAQGAPMGEVLRLFLYKLPGIVVLTFPMAMLLSALLSFGRLSGESELVAMLAAGVSLGRIMVPVVLLSLVVAVVTYQFNERLVPWTSRAAADLLAKLRPGSRTAAIIRPRYEEGRLVEIFAADSIDDRDRLHSVTFVRYSKGRPTVIVTADTATYTEAGNWQFLKGLKYVPARDGGFGGSFDEQIWYLGQTPGQIRERQKKVKPDEMTFRELQQYIEEQQAEGLPTREWEVKLYHKLSLPFTSLVMALVGAPLGLRPHRGSSSLGLGLSIIVIFIFYVITAYLHILGGNGVLNPWVAAWLPNLIGLGVAAGLLARAPR